MVLGFAAAAWAGLDRDSVSLGLAGMGANTGGGALGSAYFSMRIAGHAYFDLGAREGVVSGPTRTVTGIHAEGRYLLGEHWFVRGGFVHQHETELDRFLADPVLVILGADSSVGHYTGADLGLGLRGTLPTIHTASIHPTVSLVGEALAGSTGPRFYGVLETQLTIDLGPPPGAPTP